MIKYKSCEARLLKEKKFCESQEWNFEDLKYKPWSNLTGGTLAGYILAGNTLAGVVLVKKRKNSVEKLEKTRHGVSSFVMKKQEKVEIKAKNQRNKIPTRCLRCKK